MKHSLRHWTEYAAYRAAGGFLGVVPEVLADRGGAGVGWVAARAAPVRWSVVTEQLERAFPDRDAAWRRDIARRCYSHLGAEAIAMLRTAKLDKAGVQERTRVHGFELVEDAARAGSGVVIVTGHLGNWEVGGASVAARGYPMDVIVARQRNKLFDAHLSRSRDRLGLTVVPRAQAPSRMVGALREGRVVGILGDQDARRAGVFVDFFGRPAATARGPALLALRANAALLFGVAIRAPGARPSYDVFIERVEAERTGHLREDVIRLTQAFTSRLEHYIRLHPAQYFWLHRRWKTSPPEGDVPGGPSVTSVEGRTG